MDQFAKSQWAAWSLGGVGVLGRVLRSSGIVRALFTVVCVGSMVSQASALEVGGQLSANATWSLADSPIRVVSNLQIINGARLVIEAGVVVNFDGGKQLVIDSGSISAIGSEGAPIVFGSGQAVPQPGDWGPIFLDDGTSDSGTVFDGVVIRHGHGLKLASASPTISRVRFEQNAGPAIELDLDSSPTGIGLTAANNGLNGILVPPGTITGVVRWGLVGIPYVVAQGIVAVGLPPLALSPTTLTLRAHETGELTLELARPAPIGGLQINVASSVPSVISAPSTVTVPQGARTLSFPLQAGTAGQANVTVSHPDLGAAVAAITVLPKISISFAPAVLTVGIGQMLSMGVSLSEPATTPGISVDLSSADPLVATVPASVFVPGGSASATFNVNGIAAGDTTLSGSAPGLMSGSATLRVRDRFLAFGPFGVLAPGVGGDLTITSSVPAPPGGITIAVANSDPTIVAAPASALIASGATSTTLYVTGLASGTATLTASASGYTSSQITIAVEQIALSFDPQYSTGLPAGTVGRFSVRSSKPAPEGGLSVNLDSADSAIASVTPSAITIPEGQTVAGVRAEVLAVAIGSTTIGATAVGAFPASLDVGVVPAATLSFQGSDVVGKGMQTDVEIQRYGEDPPDDVTVTLTSSDPSRLQVPPTVTMPAHTVSASFTMTGLETSNSPVTVEMTAPGYVVDVPMTVNVVEPVIQIRDLDGSRTVGGIRDEFALDVDVPGGWDQVAIADRSLSVAVVDEDPMGVVDGIYGAIAGSNQISAVILPAGAYLTTNSAYVGTPTVEGSYRISAQADGMVGEISEQQDAGDDSSYLYFNPSTNLQLSKGLQNTDYEIARGFATPDALAVTLTPNIPGPVGIPGTVEISANEDSSTIPLVGLDLTGSPVNISADAPGYQSSSPLSITVSPASLGFQGLRSYQAVGDPRNSFELQWSSGTSPVDRPVLITLVNQNPAGVVEGLYSNDSGSDPIGILTLKTGTNQASTADADPATIYVGAPALTGSYQVQVDVPGMGTWLSPIVQVQPSNQYLLFNEFSAPIGKGLTSSYVRLERRGFSLEDSLIVELTSSDPDKVTVPAQLTFPPGARYVQVPITGVDLSPTLVGISAKPLGMTEPIGGLGVYVVQPAIKFVELRGVRGVAGERDAFYVRWDVPGVYPGYQDQPISQVSTMIDFELVDSTPGNIVDGIYEASAGNSLRHQLEIPAGTGISLTASGDIDYLYIGSPGATGTYRVRASVPGVGTWDSPVQTVQLATLEFTRSEHYVGAGLISSSLLLRRLVSGYIPEAPNELLTVNLNCIAASVCSVPASLVLGPGIYSVGVPVTGGSLGATRLVASSGGIFAAAPSDVDIRTVMPHVAISEPPERIEIGTSIALTAQIMVVESDDPDQSPVSPFQVDLSSALPGVASVPSFVVIPIGSNISADFDLLGISSGQTRITASGIGAQPTTSPRIWVSVWASSATGGGGNSVPRP
ncbi:MAG: hypothetical protein H7A19_07865 [Rhodanobacteraceae bacterium]|nr:hypothetical protein [Rhodanobacteraceae bacterium]